MGESRSTLFEDIDSMEPDRFAAHLAEDVSMRFGNAEAIQGRQAARDAWAGFCEAIDGVAHTPMGRWEIPRRGRSPRPRSPTRARTGAPSRSR